MPDPSPATAEICTPWHSLSCPYEALPLKLTLTAPARPSQC